MMTSLVKREAYLVENAGGALVCYERRETRDEARGF